MMPFHLPLDVSRILRSGPIKYSISNPFLPRGFESMDHISKTVEWPVIHPRDLPLFTDGATTVGFGGYYKGHW